MRRIGGVRAWTLDAIQSTGAAERDGAREENLSTQGTRGNTGENTHMSFTATLPGLRGFSGTLG